MSNTSFEIRLSRIERRELRRMARGLKTPHREVVRAQMILRLARGESFSKVSRTVGVARRIVYKWARRFLEERLAGLTDRPRSGRPVRFSPDRVDVLGEVGLRTPR